LGHRLQTSGRRWQFACGFSLSAPEISGAPRDNTKAKEDAMSRFQLRMHGWSIGQWFVPEGAIIDTINGTDQWSVLVKSLKLDPPLNAQPLDQATYDRMARLYDKHRIHTVPGADGIVR
jgi:hypothetical protein